MFECHVALCVGRLEHSLSRKNVGKSALAKKLCHSLGSGLARLFAACKTHLRHRKTGKALKDCYTYVISFKSMENKTEVHAEVEDILLVAAVDAAQVQLNYATNDAVKRNEKVITDMKLAQDARVVAQQKQRVDPRSKDTSVSNSAAGGTVGPIDLSFRREEEASRSEASQLVGTDAPLPQGVRPPDVEGWDSVEDDSGYWYYRNPQTGMTHWPDELAAAVAAESTPAVQEEPPGVQGWKTVLDPSGYWCYVNNKRGNAAWPEDIEEAAAEEIAISALELESSKEDTRLAAEKAEADRMQQERWKELQAARLFRHKKAMQKAAEIQEALTAAKRAHMEEESAKFETIKSNMKRIYLGAAARKVAEQGRKVELERRLAEQKDALEKADREAAAAEESESQKQAGSDAVRLKQVALRATEYRKQRALKEAEEKKLALLDEEAKLVALREQEARLKAEEEARRLQREEDEAEVKADEEAQLQHEADLQGDSLVTRAKERAIRHIASGLRKEVYQEEMTKVAVEQFIEHQAILRTSQDMCLPVVWDEVASVVVTRLQQDVLAKELQDAVLAEMLRDVAAESVDTESVRLEEEKVMGELIQAVSDDVWTELIAETLQEEVSAVAVEMSATASISDSFLAQFVTEQILDCMDTEAAPLICAHGILASVVIVEELQMALDEAWLAATRDADIENDARNEALQRLEEERLGKANKSKALWKKDQKAAAMKAEDCQRFVEELNENAREWFHANATNDELEAERVTVGLVELGMDRDAITAVFEGMDKYPDQKISKEEFETSLQEITCWNQDPLVRHEKLESHRREWARAKEENTAAKEARQQALDKATEELNVVMKLVTRAQMTAQKDTSQQAAVHRAEATALAKQAQQALGLAITEESECEKRTTFLHKAVEDVTDEHKYFVEKMQEIESNVKLMSDEDATIKGALLRCIDSVEKVREARVNTQATLVSTTSTKESVQMQARSNINQEETRLSLLKEELAQAQTSLTEYSASLVETEADVVQELARKAAERVARQIQLEEEAKSAAVALEQHQVEMGRLVTLAQREVERVNAAATEAQEGHQEAVEAHARAAKLHAAALETHDGDVENAKADTVQLREDLAKKQTRLVSEEDSLRQQSHKLNNDPLFKLEQLSQARVFQANSLDIEASLHNNEEEECEALLETAESLRSINEEVDSVLGPAEKAAQITNDAASTWVHGLGDLQALVLQRGSKLRLKDTDIIDEVIESSDKVLEAMISEHDYASRFKSALNDENTLCTQLIQRLAQRNVAAEASVEALPLALQIKIIGRAAVWKRNARARIALALGTSLVCETEESLRLLLSPTSVTVRVQMKEFVDEVANLEQIESGFVKDLTKALGIPVECSVVILREAPASAEVTMSLAARSEADEDQLRSARDLAELLLRFQTMFRDDASDLYSGFTTRDIDPAHLPVIVCVSGQSWTLRMRESVRSWLLYQGDFVEFCEACAPLLTILQEQDAEAAFTAVQIYQLEGMAGLQRLSGKLLASRKEETLGGVFGSFLRGSVNEAQPDMSCFEPLLDAEDNTWFSESCQGRIVLRCMCNVNEIVSQLRNDGLEKLAASVFEFYLTMMGSSSPFERDRDVQLLEYQVSQLKSQNLHREARRVFATGFLLHTINISHSQQCQQGLLAFDYLTAQWLTRFANWKATTANLKAAVAVGHQAQLEMDAVRVSEVELQHLTTACAKMRQMVQNCVSIANGAPRCRQEAEIKRATALFEAAKKMAADTKSRKEDANARLSHAQLSLTVAMKQLSEAAYDKTGEETMAPSDQAEPDTNSTLEKDVASDEDSRVKDKGAEARVPTQHEIQNLLANPMVETGVFDFNYGKGSAAKILREKAKPKGSAPEALHGIYVGVNQNATAPECCPQADVVALESSKEAVNAAKNDLIAARANVIQDRKDFDRVQEMYLQITAQSGKDDESLHVSTKSQSSANFIEAMSAEIQERVGTEMTERIEAEIESNMVEILETADAMMQFDAVLTEFEKATEKTVLNKTAEGLVETAVTELSSELDTEIERLKELELQCASQLQDIQSVEDDKIDAIERHCKFLMKEVAETSETSTTLNSLESDAAHMSAQSVQTAAHQKVELSLAALTLTREVERVKGLIQTHQKEAEHVDDTEDPTTQIKTSINSTESKIHQLEREIEQQAAAVESVTMQSKESVQKAVDKEAEYMELVEKLKQDLDRAEIARIEAAAEARMSDRRFEVTKLVAIAELEDTRNTHKECCETLAELEIQALQADQEMTLAILRTKALKGQGDAAQLAKEVIDLSKKAGRDPESGARQEMIKWIQDQQGIGEDGLDTGAIASIVIDEFDEEQSRKINLVRHSKYSSRRKVDGTQGSGKPMPPAFDDDVSSEDEKDLPVVQKEDSAKDTMRQVHGVPKLALHTSSEPDTTRLPEPEMAESSVLKAEWLWDGKALSKQIDWLHQLETAVGRDDASSQTTQELTSMIESQDNEPTVATESKPAAPQMDFNEDVIEDNEILEILMLEPDCLEEDLDDANEEATVVSGKKLLLLESILPACWLAWNSLYTADYEREASMFDSAVVVAQHILSENDEYALLNAGCSALEAIASLQHLTLRLRVAGRQEVLIAFKLQDILVSVTRVADNERSQYQVLYHDVPLRAPDQVVDVSLLAALETSQALLVWSLQSAIASELRATRLSLMHLQKQAVEFVEALVSLKAEHTRGSKNLTADPNHTREDQLEFGKCVSAMTSLVVDLAFGTTIQEHRVVNQLSAKNEELQTFDLHKCRNQKQLNDMRTGIKRLTSKFTYDDSTLKSITVAFLSPQRLEAAVQLCATVGQRALSEGMDLGAAVMGNAAHVLACMHANSDERIVSCHQACCEIQELKGQPPFAAICPAEIAEFITDTMSKQDMLLGNKKRDDARIAEERQAQELMKHVPGVISAVNGALSLDVCANHVARLQEMIGNLEFGQGMWTVDHLQEMNSDVARCREIVGELRALGDSWVEPRAEHGFVVLKNTQASTKAIRKTVLAIMQCAKRACTFLGKAVPGEDVKALLELLQQMTEFGLLEQGTDFEEIGSIAMAVVQHLNGTKHTISEAEGCLAKFKALVSTLEPMIKERIELSTKLQDCASGILEKTKTRKTREEDEYAKFTRLDMLQERDLLSKLVKLLLGVAARDATLGCDLARLDELVSVNTAMNRGAVVVENFIPLLHEMHAANVIMENAKTQVVTSCLQQALREAMVAKQVAEAAQMHDIGAINQLYNALDLLPKALIETYDIALMDDVVAETCQIIMSMRSDGFRPIVSNLFNVIRWLNKAGKSLRDVLLCHKAACESKMNKCRTILDGMAATLKLRKEPALHSLIHQTAGYARLLQIDKIDDQEIQQLLSLLVAMKHAMAHVDDSSDLVTKLNIVCIAIESYALVLHRLRQLKATCISLSLLDHVEKGWRMMELLPQDREEKHEIFSEASDLLDTIFITAHRREVSLCRLTSLKHEVDHLTTQKLDAKEVESAAVVQMMMEPLEQFIFLLSPRESTTFKKEVKYVQDTSPGLLDLLDKMNYKKERMSLDDCRTALSEVATSANDDNMDVSMITDACDVATELAAGFRKHASDVKTVAISTLSDSLSAFALQLVCVSAHGIKKHAAVLEATLQGLTHDLHVHVKQAETLIQSMIDAERREEASAMQTVVDTVLHLRQHRIASASFDRDSIDTWPFSSREAAEVNEDLTLQRLVEAMEALCKIEAKHDETHRALKRVNTQRLLSLCSLHGHALLTILRQQDLKDDAMSLHRLLNAVGMSFKSEMTPEEKSAPKSQSEILQTLGTQALGHVKASSMENMTCHDLQRALASIPLKQAGATLLAMPPKQRARALSSESRAATHVAMMTASRHQPCLEMISEAIKLCTTSYTKWSTRSGATSLLSSSCQLLELLYEVSATVRDLSASVGVVKEQSKLFHEVDARSKPLGKSATFVRKGHVNVFKWSQCKSAPAIVARMGEYMGVAVSQPGQIKVEELCDSIEVQRHCASMRTKDRISHALAGLLVASKLVPSSSDLSLAPTPEALRRSVATARQARGIDSWICSRVMESAQKLLADQELCTVEEETRARNSHLSDQLWCLHDTVQRAVVTAEPSVPEESSATTLVSMCECLVHIANVLSGDAQGEWDATNASPEYDERQDIYDTLTSFISTKGEHMAQSKPVIDRCHSWLLAHSTLAASSVYLQLCEAMVRLWNRDSRSSEGQISRLLRKACFRLHADTLNSSRNCHVMDEQCRLVRLLITLTESYLDTLHWELNVVSLCRKTSMRWIMSIVFQSGRTWETECDWEKYRLVMELLQNLSIDGIQNADSLKATFDLLPVSQVTQEWSAMKSRGNIQGSLVSLLLSILETSLTKWVHGLEEHRDHLQFKFISKCQVAGTMLKADTPQAALDKMAILQFCTHWQQSVNGFEVDLQQMESHVDVLDTHSPMAKEVTTLFEGVRTAHHESTQGHAMVWQLRVVCAASGFDVIASEFRTAGEGITSKSPAFLFETASQLVDLKGQLERTMWLGQNVTVTGLMEDASKVREVSLALIGKGLHNPAAHVAAVAQLLEDQVARCQSKELGLLVYEYAGALRDVWKSAQSPILSANATTTMAARSIMKVLPSSASETLAHYDVQGLHRRAQLLEHLANKKRTAELAEELKKDDVHAAWAAWEELDFMGEHDMAQATPRLSMATPGLTTPRLTTPRVEAAERFVELDKSTTEAVVNLVEDMRSLHTRKQHVEDCRWKHRDLRRRHCARLAQGCALCLLDHPEDCDSQAGTSKVLQAYMDVLQTHVWRDQGEFAQHAPAAVLAYCCDVLVDLGNSNRTPSDFDLPQMAQNLDAVKKYLEAVDLTDVISVVIMVQELLAEINQTQVNEFASATGDKDAAVAALAIATDGLTKSKSELSYHRNIPWHGLDELISTSQQLIRSPLNLHSMQKARQQVETLMASLKHAGMSKLDAVLEVHVCLERLHKALNQAQVRADVCITSEWDTMIACAEGVQQRMALYDISPTHSEWRHLLQWMQMYRMNTTGLSLCKMCVLAAGCVAKFIKLEDLDLVHEATVVHAHLDKLTEDATFEMQLAADLQVSQHKDNCTKLIPRVEAAADVLRIGHHVEGTMPLSLALLSLSKVSAGDFGVVEIMQASQELAYCRQTTSTSVIGVLLRDSIEEMTLFGEALGRRNEALKLQLMIRLRSQIGSCIMALHMLNRNGSSNISNHLQDVVTHACDRIVWDASAATRLPCDYKELQASANLAADCLYSRGYHTVGNHVSSIVTTSQQLEEICTVEFESQCAENVRHCRTVWNVINSKSTELGKQIEVPVTQTIEGMMLPQEMVATKLWQGASTALLFGRELLTLHEQHQREVVEAEAKAAEIHLGNLIPSTEAVLDDAKPAREIPLVDPKDEQSKAWHGPLPTRFTAGVIVDEMRAIFQYEFQCRLVGPEALLAMLNRLSKSLGHPMPFAASSYKSRYGRVVKRLMGNLGTLTAAEGDVNKSDVRLEFYEFLHLMSCKPFIQLLPYKTRATLPLLLSSEVSGSPGREIARADRSEAYEDEDGPMQLPFSKMSPEKAVLELQSTQKDLVPLAFALVSGGSLDGGDDDDDDDGVVNHLAAVPQPPPALPLALGERSAHSQSGAGKVVHDAYFLYMYHFSGTLVSLEQLVSFMQQLWSLSAKPAFPLHRLKGRYVLRLEALLARLAGMIQIGEHCLPAKAAKAPRQEGEEDAPPAAGRLHFWQVLQILCARPFIAMLPRDATEDMARLADAVLADEADDDDFKDDDEEGFADDELKGIGVEAAC